MFHSFFFIIIFSTVRANVRDEIELEDGEIASSGEQSSQNNNGVIGNESTRNVNINSSNVF